MSRCNYDHAVDKRRNQENKVLQYNNYLKEDKNNQHKMNWEIKTGKGIDNKQEQVNSREIQEQRLQFLNMRRKKLSDLLTSEQKAYHQEVITNQETPDQNRNKMEIKLTQLKAENEKERLDYVKQQQDKKFYNAADELRKNDSQTFAISCYLEQENQMLDKLKQKAKERREEDSYVVLNEFDNKKKLEREQRQEMEKREKVRATYDYLSWQKEQEEEALRRALELKEKEKEKLKEQWSRDDRNEREEKEKMHQQNVQVYKDIEDFNKKEEEERTKKSQIERKKDKELINAILEKEKALDHLDLLEKEKKKKEFYQNQKYLDYIMHQKKEAEAWMDKLAQREADMKYQKENEKWMKEEAARIELLKQVYREREKAVLYKANAKGEERMQIEKERMILDEEIQNYNRKVTEMKLAEGRIRKAHQDELLYQISEKEHQKKIENQDKLYEKRAAELWEREYQNKINEQKEIHQQKLAEIRNRNNY